MVLKSGNGLNLKRLDHQLGINGIAETAPTNRNRALEKWESARTWIRDLIRHTPCFRKATWVSGASRWIRRFVNVGMGRSRERIHELFMRREDATDRTVQGEWVRENGIGCSSYWSGLSEWHPELRRGIHALAQIRAGTFATGRSLAAKRILPSKYLRECPFCEVGEPETIVHLLRRCPRWREQRPELLLDPDSDIRPNRMPAAEQAPLGRLLGGGAQTTL